MAKAPKNKSETDSKTGEADKPSETDQSADSGTEKAAGAADAETSEKAPSAKAGAWGKPAKADAETKSQNEQSDKSDAAEPAYTHVELPPPSADVAPPRQSSAVLRAFAWLSMVFALLIVVAAVSWPWWSERLAAAFPQLRLGGGEDPVVAVLAGRVDALEERARALESERSAAVSTLEEQRAQFSSTIEGLMGRFADLEKELKQTRELAAIAQSADDVTAANQSLEALASRLARLEKEDGRVEGLVARLTRIEKEGASSVQGSAERDSRLRAALQEVTDRLQILETKSPAGSSDEVGARAMVLAVAQLRDTVKSGLAYAADLEALQAVAGERKIIADAIEVLTRRADTGVPSLAQLRGQFGQVAGQVAAAGDQAPESGDWVARTTERLKSLVRIRQVGETADPNTREGAVAMAERLLGAGDLKSAVTVLSKLDGPAAELLAPWLSSAGDRIEIEKALAALHVHAVSRLGVQEGRANNATRSGVEAASGSVGG